MKVGDMIFCRKNCPPYFTAGLSYVITNRITVNTLVVIDDNQRERSLLKYGTFYNEYFTLPTNLHKILYLGE